MKIVSRAPAPAPAAPAPKAGVDPVVAKVLVTLAEMQAGIMGTLAELGASRDRPIVVQLPPEKEEEEGPEKKRRLRVEVTGRDMNGGIQSLTIEEL